MTTLNYRGRTYASMNPTKDFHSALVSALHRILPKAEFEIVDLSIVLSYRARQVRLTPAEMGGNLFVLGFQKYWFDDGRDQWIYRGAAKLSSSYSAEEAAAPITRYLLS